MNSAIFSDNRCSFCTPKTHLSETAMSEQNGRRLSVAVRSRCGWGLCYPAQRTHGELTGNMDQGDVSRATGGGIRSNLLRRRRSPVGVRLPWRRSRMKLERRSSYRVSGPLTPGGCVSYRNRRYRLLEILDHTTRHRHNTQLLKREGACIECGEKFTFESSRSRFNALARCKPHR